MSVRVFNHDEVPALLTSKEVAQKFKLGVETITKLRKSGQLPAIRLGQNTIRFRQSDVEEFLASHVAQTPTK